MFAQTNLTVRYGLTSNTITANSLDCKLLKTPATAGIEVKSHTDALLAKFTDTVVQFHKPSDALYGLNVNNGLFCDVAQISMLQVTIGGTATNTLTSGEITCNGSTTSQGLVTANS